MASTRKFQIAKLRNRLETLAQALEKEARQSDHYESGLTHPQSGYSLDHADAAAAVREALRYIFDRENTR